MRKMPSLCFCRFHCVVVPRALDIDKAGLQFDVIAKGFEICTRRNCDFSAVR